MFSQDGLRQDIRKRASELSRDAVAIAKSVVRRDRRTPEHHDAPNTPSAATRQLATADDYYQRGHELENQGRWIAAATAYRHAIVLSDEERPDWLYRLGVVLEKGGDWSNARHAYRNAIGSRRLLAPEKRPSLPNHDLTKQIDLSLVRLRPQYLYITFKAAQLAAALNVTRITAIEFGVAGGNGLVALEQHAATVADATGVTVDVVGFDTGEGLFEPVDYRDMPYMFRQGNFGIDPDALQARLRSAQLILGDAGTTFAAFLAELDGAPIGAVAFDMDYYSATRDVLAHFSDSGADRHFLPRISTYFDNVTGRVGQDYNEYTGELLAISEFNAANQAVKLAEDRYFRELPLNFAWHHSIYTMHRHTHADYNRYVRPLPDYHLPLTE